MAFRRIKIGIDSTIGWWYGLINTVGFLTEGFLDMNISSLVVVLNALRLRR